MVPFMHQQAALPTQLGGTTQAVELPYDGGRLAMLVVIPSDGRRSRRP